MIGYVIVLAMLGCAMIAILVALSLDDRAPHQAPAADAKDGGG